MSVTLFVGNLPFSIDDDQLMTVFSQAGEVLTVKIIKDKYSGSSRGFGFVKMNSNEDGKKAIDMFNGKDFEGRQMVVNKARLPNDLDI